jgi:hypothetical protein
MVAVAVLASIAAAVAAPPVVQRVNVIDGTDERGPITERGPAIGLSAGEIARIRAVAGHVGCFEPVPTVGSGALFLTSGLVLTAGHIFFQKNGAPAAKCFFRAQTAGSDWVPLETGAADARFGAIPPRPGSNQDWAVVRLAAPIKDAVPFPPARTPPRAGEALIVVSAHPEGFEAVDPAIPIVQDCRVRRAPVSSSTTSFYRSDCDASGASSGGMHLAREGGALVFRGMTISTGPTHDPAFRGAPYDEKGGSVTTALGTDAAILRAAESLARGE